MAVNISGDFLEICHYAEKDLQHLSKNTKVKKSIEIMVI